MKYFTYNRIEGSIFSILILPEIRVPQTNIDTDTNILLLETNTQHLKIRY